MCVLCPNRLVYFRLSKAKRSQKFSALKLHFLSLGRDRLTAPAPNFLCPRQLLPMGVFTFRGLRISGSDTRLWVARLSGATAAHKTREFTCVSASMGVGGSVPWAAVMRRSSFPWAGKTASTSTPTQHQNRQ